MFEISHSTTPGSTEWGARQIENYLNGRSSKRAQNLLSELLEQALVPTPRDDHMRRSTSSDEPRYELASFLRPEMEGNVADRFIQPAGLPSSGRPWVPPGFTPGMLGQLGPRAMTGRAGEIAMMRWLLQSLAEQRLLLDEPKPRRKWLDCERQAEEDEAVCRHLNAPRDVKDRCWASVQERYGACTAGKPLPPLVTW